MIFSASILESRNLDSKTMPKIFIGVHEIANFIKEFADALSDAGYRVETLALPGKFYSNNQYTYHLKTPPLFRKTKITRFLYPMFMLPFYLPLIFKFDIFIFVWTTTFLPLNIDLFLLRFLRKRVMVFNCGDDVRYRPIQYKIDKHEFAADWFGNQAALAAYLQHGITFIRAFYTQKVEEWSGCQIISMRNQATFQKKDYYLFRFPTKKLIERPKKTNSTPLIIHAPSDRVVKGTKYVLEAVKLLRDQGLCFEFELIEGQANEYVLSRLVAADIVIDQPWGWIAKFAAEGLAAGCVVVGGNRPDYEGFDDASPVIQFNPNSNELACALKEIILNEGKRQMLMDKSYEYWLNHYSSQAFVAYFNQLLTGRAKKFSAPPNYKALLLQYALNRYQKLLIRIFY